MTKRAKSQHPTATRCPDRARPRKKNIQALKTTKLLAPKTSRAPPKRDTPRTEKPEEGRPVIDGGLPNASQDAGHADERDPQKQQPGKKEKESKE